jgi:hypothetical protein
VLAERAAPRVRQIPELVAEGKGWLAVHTCSGPGWDPDDRRAPRAVAQPCLKALCAHKLPPGELKDYQILRVCVSPGRGDEAHSDHPMRRPKLEFASQIFKVATTATAQGHGRCIVIVAQMPVQPRSELASIWTVAARTGLVNGDKLNLFFYGLGSGMSRRKAIFLKLCFLWSACRR